MNKKRIYEKPLIYQTLTHTHVYVSTIQSHIIVASFVIEILSVFSFFLLYSKSLVFQATYSDDDFILFD
jgi:hypothetical protein